VFETAAYLNQSKAGLSHGEFLAMIESDLPFGPRTAQRLMNIGENHQLANTTHASYLPASWMTLYELSRLTDKQFNKATESSAIHPKMGRFQKRTMVCFCPPAGERFMSYPGSPTKSSTAPSSRRLKSRKNFAGGGWRM
jgi:hypothetical protein